MKKQFLLVVTLCAVLISACHTKQLVAPVNNGIVGNWKFVKAVGGFTGTTTVNATYQLVYTFNADSTYKQTKNNTLQNRGRFYIRTDKSIFSGKMEPAISFSAPTTGTGFLYSIKADTLILTENHVEPFAYRYVRLK